MNKKFCRACGGKLCEFCGGCIDQGECSCFTDAKTSTILKQAARVAELEALLREVTTSIEFDELGLRDLDERIRKALVP